MQGTSYKYAQTNIIPDCLYFSISLQYALRDYVYKSSDYVFSALVAIAQIYTGRPNDILPAITQLDASEFEPGQF